ncbi:metalloregulator ArsR/SmtB family transcription factor [Magnetovibrio sp. PR-2]|uniref:ArsR/SmtB family transcription factor n=1 Tax=Magnetovibrio sp. PR-2 TaxID=3120356 RepID=UPI002FCDE385
MEHVLDALRAAADPTRLRILGLLAAGELTVSELVSILGQSQPRVSRHLKILVEAGLLQRFREGSWVFHRIQPGAGGTRAAALVDLVPQEDPLRMQDKVRLREIEDQRSRAAEDYFAKFAPEWDRLRQLDVDEEAVATAVREMLPLTSQQKLLDLGTGTGRMLQVLGPDVGEALGLDNSHEMLAVARANVKRWGLENCQLRQADIMALPVAFGTFDAVVIHQVLHFLDRPWAAIAESVRALQPGGRLLIVDLAPHDVEELREQHAHRRLGFEDEEIQDWLLTQGLSLETIKHLPGKLGVTIWLARKSGVAGLNAQDQGALL